MIKLLRISLGGLLICLTLAFSACTPEEEPQKPTPNPAEAYSQALLAELSQDFELLCHGDPTKTVGDKGTVLYRASAQLRGSDDQWEGLDEKLARFGLTVGPMGLPGVVLSPIHAYDKYSPNAQYFLLRPYTKTYQSDCGRGEEQNLEDGDLILQVTTSVESHASTED